MHRLRSHALFMQNQDQISGNNNSYDNIYLFNCIVLCFISTMLIQHASSEVFLNSTNLVEHGYNPIQCRWYKDTMLLDPSEKQMMQSFGSRLDSLFKTWVWIKIMLVWAMSLLLFFQINISRGCFIIILHQRFTSCSHTNAGTVSSWRTWASQTLETILVSLKTHSEGIRWKRW